MPDCLHPIVNLLQIQSKISSRNDEMREISSGSMNDVLDAVLLGLFEKQLFFRL